MLVLALELAWLCRHLGVRTRPDFGYGLPWRRFLKVSMWWGAAGVASGGVGAAFLLATHLRILSDASQIDSAAAIAHLLLAGLISGISVALIEETVFRGAMHTAIVRESGPWSAVLLTAPLFAILHFFAKASIAPELLHWGSGFDLLLLSFAPLGSPTLVIDSFLAWLAVGLILSFTRVLTGNIAAAIGLHAGWVLVLRILQLSTASGGGTPIFRVGRPVRRFAGLLAAAVGRRPGARALALARRMGALRERRERRQLVQALNGIVDLQADLLVGERYRQYFRQSMTHPRGIVEPHRDIRVHLPQLRQHRAQQFGQARMPRRHRQQRFGVEPLDLAEMQAVGLTALLDDAKSLPPNAGYAEQAVLQLMKIGDLGHGADRVNVGIAAVRPPGPRESRRRRSPGPRAYSGAPCRGNAFQRYAAAARRPGNSTMLSGNSAIELISRSGLAPPKCGEQFLVQSAEAAVAHHQHLVARLQLARIQPLDQGVHGAREADPPAAAARSQPPNPSRVAASSRTTRDPPAPARAPVDRGARRVSWYWSAARARR